MAAVPGYDHWFVMWHNVHGLDNWLIFTCSVLGLYKRCLDFTEYHMSSHEKVQAGDIVSENMPSYHALQSKALTTRNIYCILIHNTATHNIPEGKGTSKISVNKYALHAVCMVNWYWQWHLDQMCLQSVGILIINYLHFTQIYSIF